MPARQCHWQPKLVCRSIAPEQRLTYFPNIGLYDPSPCHHGRVAKRFSRRAGNRGPRPVCRTPVPELRALAGTAPREKSYVRYYGLASEQSGRDGLRLSPKKGRRFAQRERTCVSFEPPLLTGTPSSWRLFTKTGLSPVGDRRPGPLVVSITRRRAREGAAVSGAIIFAGFAAPLLKRLSLQCFENLGWEFNTSLASTAARVDRLLVLRRTGLQASPPPPQIRPGTSAVSARACWCCSASNGSCRKG